MSALHPFSERMSPTDIDSAAQENLYWLRAGRQIYTSGRIAERVQPRYLANVTISLDHNPFTIASAEKSEDGFVAAVCKPMAACKFNVHKVRAIAFLFDPSHPLFPRFRRIGGAGTMSLPQAHFAHLSERLAAAYSGTLEIQEAEQLFEEVTQITMRFLPRMRSIDKRVARVVQILTGNDDYSLEDLARAVDLSYYRLSHLFVENMGLTLRAFQQWRKLRRALALFRNIENTFVDVARESGFVDAAHFRRTFSHVHGVAPSYFLRSGRVNIVARPRSRLRLVQSRAAPSIFERVGGGRHFDT